MFLGCQDPWNVNPRVPLPACTNVTYIRASYGDPEDDLLHRHAMSKKELVEIPKNGKKCMTPCSQVKYNVKFNNVPRDK